MSVSDLSVSAQNYLKVIWGLSESASSVTAADIAQRTGLQRSTVSEAVAKLTADGLLHHARYGAVELTDLGRRHALTMVRRHRLIETFLVRALRYGWDEVHDEAENLEHAVSDLLVDRIDEFLEFPRHDPHGDPIPAADGTMVEHDAVQLSSVGFDVPVVVVRVSDGDPNLLRFFEEHGIVLAAELVVHPGTPYSDAVDVQVVGGDHRVSLGRAARDALSVVLTNG